MPAGPLAPLCGVFLPHLLHAGFTSDNMVYVLVVELIDGTHASKQAPTTALHCAIQVGNAAVFHVVTHLHSCNLELLTCCQWLLQALSSVHRAGLAHGDVYHNNIIVQGDKVSVNMQHESCCMMCGIVSPGLLVAAVKAFWHSCPGFLLLAAPVPELCSNRSTTGT